MVNLKKLNTQHLKIKTKSLLSCTRKSHTIQSFEEVKKSKIPTKAKENYKSNKECDRHANSKRQSFIKSIRK